jgi:hypothetical protein
LRKRASSGTEVDIAFRSPALPEEVLEADEPVLPVGPVGARAVGDDLADVVGQQVVVEALAGVGAPDAVLLNTCESKVGANPSYNFFNLQL